MSACPVLHIAIQSIHQTVRSFVSLPLREQVVHSCNLLLLLLLDANNTKKLQVMFVSPATIPNAIFNTLIISMYYGTTANERHSMDPDVTSSLQHTSYQML